MEHWEGPRTAQMHFQHFFIFPNKHFKCSSIWRSQIRCRHSPNMISLQSCQCEQQRIHFQPLATALKEHLPSALPVPLWELLPLHHNRIRAKLPEHYRVRHLKGVRGLCFPNLPFFFHSSCLVCNYIYLATSVRLGKILFFIIHS